MRKLIAAAVLPAAALGLAGCEVEQTEEGELPEVEGGNLPEYDVESQDVDVEMEEETIEVPTLEVGEEDEAQAGE